MAEQEAARDMTGDGRQAVNEVAEKEQTKGRPFEICVDESVWVGPRYKRVGKVGLHQDMEAMGVCER
jgi:hypothetical protein